jgi:hypothetical protein
MMSLALRGISVHISKGSLTCCKILQYGADGFTSPPKESVLQIFIAYKIHRPRLGLNPQTLRAMPCTLTIRPPRTTRSAPPVELFFFGISNQKIAKTNPFRIYVLLYRTL